MLRSVTFVIVTWMLGELILYVVHCWRHRRIVSVPRRQEDRVLISVLGLTFGMFVACLVYLKLTYY